MGNSNLDFGIDIRGFNVTIVGLKIKNFTDGSAFFEHTTNANAIGDIVLDHIVVNTFILLSLYGKLLSKG